jgi:hypothetical protein
MVATAEPDDAVAVADSREQREMIRPPRRQRLCQHLLDKRLAVDSGVTHQRVRIPVPVRAFPQRVKAVRDAEVASADCCDPLRQFVRCARRVT